MGRLEKLALLFLLIIALVSNCESNEILDRIEAIEKTNKKLVEENKSKSSRINLLEEQNVQMSTTLNAMSVAMNAVLIQLNETKEDISNTEENVLAMAKNLVENEIREINNQVMTQKEYDSLVNPPESCGELSLYGVSDSKKLLIDPDGKGVENDPIEVSYTSILDKAM